MGMQIPAGKSGKFYLKIVASSSAAHRLANSSSDSPMAPGETNPRNELD
jgi:hypothetical protein